MVRHVESPVYAGAFSSAARKASKLEHRSGHAVGRMTAKFADCDPVILLVSHWARNARFMVDRFLETLPDNVAVARVTAPCHGAASTLRAILTAFGAQQTHLNVDLLEEELKHVLVKQMNYCKRSLICFETNDEIEPWVLDRAQRLIELEAREKYGLTVILSGGPSLRDVLTQAPYSEFVSIAGEPIDTGPLTLAETRDYIGRQTRRAGVSNVYQVFEFAAMTAIHEFCRGKTNSIDALCNACIELSDAEDKRPVSPAMVRRAHAELAAAEPKPGKNGKAAANGAKPGGRKTARLVAKMNGSLSQEVAVKEGRLLIGRAELCDLPLPSLTVSRQHAMVVKMETGIGLVDLGSTNGTFVDGKRVKQHLLQDGERIRVGDCTITFLEGND